MIILKFLSLQSIINIQLYSEYGFDIAFGVMKSGKTVNLPAAYGEIVMNIVE